MNQSLTSRINVCVSHESILMFASDLFPQVKNNRDYVLIVSDILFCAARGVKKTELMCKVGLSSTQLEKYVMLLVKADLLESSSEDKKLLYKTTVKGKDFLVVFGELAKLLDSNLTYSQFFSRDGNETSN
jgi:predicted transcriptional regulator